MTWADVPAWRPVDAFRRVFDKFVAEVRDGERIVVVGLGFGRSIAYLARRVIDSGKRVHLIGVDPFDDIGGWGGDACAFAELLGGPLAAFRWCTREHVPEEIGRVVLWRKTSLDAARATREASRAFVFLDTEPPTFEAARAELAAWAPRVKRSGMLAGVATREHERRAVREAFANGGFGRAEGGAWTRRNP